MGPRHFGRELMAFLNRLMDGAGHAPLAPGCEPDPLATRMWLDSNERGRAEKAAGVIGPAAAEAQGRKCGDWPLRR